MRPSFFLVLVVTWVIATMFCGLAIFTIVAAGRWAFTPGASAVELVRAGSTCVVSFAAMQGWSYYLRHTPAN